MDTKGSLGWAAAPGLTAQAAFGAAALFLPPASSPERISSAGHTYLLPPAAEVSHTLLADGRTLEVHGAEGGAYRLDGSSKRRLALPEARRFASVTVMPGGQVLLWGGI